jgi:hypothetical protein
VEVQVTGPIGLDTGWVMDFGDVKKAFQPLYDQLDRRAVWRIVDGLVLAGVLVAVIGLVQYAFNLNIITAEEGVRRLRSLYGSPNNVGLFLGRVFPIGLAVALVGLGSRRIFYGLALLPIGAAIFLSQSRGAIFMACHIDLAIGLLAGGRWLWATLGVDRRGIAAIPLLNSPRIQALFSGGRRRSSVWRWKHAGDDAISRGLA